MSADIYWAIGLTLAIARFVPELARYLIDWKRSAGIVDFQASCEEFLWELWRAVFGGLLLAAFWPFWLIHRLSSTTPDGQK